MLGIYECSKRKASFETGIPLERLETILKAFEGFGKVKIVDNFIILKNYMKHQRYNTNMKKSAIDIYNSLPDKLKINGLDVSKDNPLKGFERLSKGLGMVSKVEVEYEVEYEVEEEDEFNREKDAREEKNSTDKISEKEFLTLWAEIRESYDKKPSYFKKLNFYEKQKFEKLKDEYDEEEFKEAITGLFMQKNMFESNRVRPNHFLENFDTYRDCFHNNSQLFEKPEYKPNSKPKLPYTPIAFDTNRP